MVRVLFGSAFPSNVVGFGHCFVTLPLTINEPSKGLVPLPISVQNHSGGDSVALGMPLVLNPPPSLDPRP